MKKLVLFSFIVATFLQTSFSQTADKYLGLTPPGTTPEIFAPGVVSVEGRKERVITFSPSGHEIFFAIGDWPTRTTMYIEYKNGAWLSPVTASFSTDRSAEETFFSLDGNRVYYYAYPPSSTSNPDIYYSEKSGDIWSAPINVGTSLNTTGEEYHPNIVNDGSIYFSNTAGKTYRSQFNGVDFDARVLLPNNVNSTAWQDHYVSPDESYMIFTSAKAGGIGAADLYISFHNGDGSWTNPQNFGAGINTSGNEYSADITPDGLYMTFNNDVDILWVKIDEKILALRATSGVTSDVNSDFKNQNIEIYPNPGKGIFNFSLGTFLGKSAVVEISNIEGKIIVKNTLKNNDIIDLSNKSKGIYFVKLYIDNQIITKKICIE